MLRSEELSRLFNAVPTAFLAIACDAPKFTMLAANDAYVQVSGVRRDELLGRGVFEVFPADPDNAASGAEDLLSSLLRVVASGCVDELPVQRYDVAVAGGGFEEHYWRAVNTPVLDSGGGVEYILHSVEEITEKVCLEQQARIPARGLHISEKRFQKLTEASGIGVLIADLSGTLSYLNPSALDLLGYSADEFSAGLIRWDQLTPPEFAAMDAEAWQQVQATGKCKPYEKVYLAKDGRRIPILIGASLLETADGRTEAAAFFVDLTDRMESKRDAFLVRLDDATRQLADPDEILCVTARMIAEYLVVDRCHYCDFDADEEWLSVTAEYARPGLRLLAGRYRITDFGATYASLLRAKLPFVLNDVESDPSTADVRIAYRQVGIRALIGVPMVKGGRLVSMMSVHQDMPRNWLAEDVELLKLVMNRCWESIERAHASHAWQASERRLRLAQQVGRIGSFEWLLPEERILWTPELEELYGLAEGTFSGTPAHWRSLMVAEDAERVFAEIESGIGHHEADCAFELRAMLPDGGLRWLRGQGRFFYNEAGTPEKMVGVNIDITEQRRIEQELRRMNRELEEFSYVTAHDLQEPLRMVNLSTQLMFREIGTEQLAKSRFAVNVERGVTHMQALIHDLLTFSQMVHTSEAPIGAADLSAALADALSMLSHQIEESGAKVSFVVLPHVRADRQQMAQVFQNLLSNALKYRSSSRTPEIQIACEIEGDRCTVSVSDNGIGFDPRYAMRIFGLFKRLHKDEYEGTGLGLAICKRIVEQYGGRIWAEGLVGEGATFYFSLAGVR